MKYLTNASRASRDLLWAAGKALAAEWHAGKGRLLFSCLVVFVFSALPYVGRGAEALMLNHLQAVVAHRALDALMVGLVVLVGLAAFFESTVRDVGRFIQRQTFFARRRRYELAFASKLSSLGPAVHEDPEFQDRVQVLEENGSALAIANFIDGLNQTGGSLLSFVLAAAIVLGADWRICALVFAANVPRLCIEFMFQNGLWDAIESQSADRRMYFELRRHTRTAPAVRDLQLFGLQPHFLGRMHDSLERFLGAQLKQERKRLLLETVAELVLLTATGVSLWLLIERVIGGGMGIGTFVFIYGAIFSLGNATSGLMMNVAELQRDVKCVKAYYAIMEFEDPIRSPSHAVRVRTDRAPRIEFRDVSFAYPAKPDERIISGLSLAIEPGERFALVGVNGAGKTTLIRLLCRIYDPTEGAILLDGVDLRDIDLDSWRERVALLAQDFDTYRFRAGESIRLGRVDAPACGERTEAAAYRSESASFIERFPEQYEQQIGTEFGGIDLSGGQRQKLALARALYRDATVTVLDEPTAHVDAGAEQEIFERLESQMRPEQTLFLISHRFSTVRNADRICILKDGRVAELGSHDELVRQGGIYAGLFRKQAKAYQ